MMPYYKIVGFIFLLLFIIIDSGLTSVSTGWILLKKIQVAKPSSVLTTVSGESSGIIYNPSILSTIEKREIITFAEIGMFEDKLFGIVYTQPLKNIHTIAIGVTNYNVGKVKLYWIENGIEHMREVDAQKDYLVSFLFSTVINRKLSVGISAKFASSNIAEMSTAQAYMVDVGILYRIGERMTISFVGENFGVSTKFLYKTEKLPTEFSISCGYIYNISENTQLLLGTNMKYAEERFIPSIGMEGRKKMLSIFAEYKFNPDKNISVGVGITMKTFSLNYSYVLSQLFSSSNRITLVLKF